VGRSRIELLTEHASRMGRGGEFINVTAVPKDGLRRVIVGESLISEYTVEPDETSEFPSLMHLCVQAMGALTHPSAIFWCFGEQRLGWLLKMKSHWGDALRYVPSEQNDQFFVFKAEAGRAQNRTIWPILQNELSLHLFAIEDRNALVHCLLDDIYHGMESRPEESKLRIKELNGRCLIRSEVVHFLKEAPWILLPDGSHYQYPAIHTSTLQINTIAECFENLAQEYNINYDCHENEADEYFRFFQSTI
jgi:hypothetical protein